jgi:hypothetical protein
MVGCNNDKNLEITGNIKGLQKGTLYIKQLSEEKFITLDSIQIEGKSNFETNIELKSPEMLYLFLDRGTSNTMDNYVMFFAEPGKMNIDTELDLFYAKAKITGSRNQDLYEEYKKVNSRFNEQLLTLTAEKFNSLKSKNTNAITENQSKSDAVIKRKYLYAINFAVNNKDQEIAPYIALSEINNATTKYLDTIQKSMTPKVAQSKYGTMLTKFVQERKKQE